MNLNKELLANFEKQLNPQSINSSKIAAKLIGYGEISSIFELEAMPGIVLKRMPMFSNHEQAGKYSAKYNKYCELLKKAGLSLPSDETTIVEKSKQLTVLYIAQEKFDPAIIGNKIINIIPENEIEKLAERIIQAIYGVWAFNKSNSDVELAIDSQISNWAYVKQTDTLFYMDTSTPIFKINDVEQMEPELVLASAPSFARAIIRRFFLDDVMNRYYDEKSVNIDLIANLYKEQKANLIPLFLNVVNRFSANVITEKEIADYYKEDKFIWQLFLSMRKLDRWLYKYVYKKQYEFILPGRIKR